MERRGITRRSFLVSAAATATAGAAAAGAWTWLTYDDESSSSSASGRGRLFPTDEPLGLSSGKLLDTQFPDPFAGGQIVGYLPFLGEDSGGSPPLVPGRTSGPGHGARRIIDTASLLLPRSRVTPANQFFIRTEYPDKLVAPEVWKIKIGGEVHKPQDLPITRLGESKPQGPVLLECSGNHRSLKFGLLSVADWDGVPIREIFDLAQPTPKAKAVLINGFDDDSNLPDTGPPYREHSWPTCSWVFTFDQLEQAGAFLATRMNGGPLPKDQGAPVRLVVPGWFGCTEVKWVNEIKFVDSSQPATLQMLEFSTRTFQDIRPKKIHPDDFHFVGPALARDYRPATIDQSVLPLRVEQWKLGGKIAYRVVGITWGGPNRTDKLKIRFRRPGNNARFEPVQFCATKTSNLAYGIWVHVWEPKEKGPYFIDVQLAAPGARSRRLSLKEGPSPTAIGQLERIVYIPAV